MKEMILFKNEGDNDGTNYDNCINFLDYIEKMLEICKFTIYDVDKNNKEYPKNIKIEPRAFLGEINKLIIHHYRCHIHVIADANTKNTVNGSNLEVSFTLSHRFKVEKGYNRHSHIYLSLHYDSEQDKIIYDGYLKKQQGFKKILENTNPDEIADFLLFENYLRMTTENFQYIEQPINEKQIYNDCLEMTRFKSNKNFEKSFFILRDNIFWSKLIKYSIKQLFTVFDCLLRIKDHSIIANNFKNSVNKDEFQYIIDQIKAKHLPDEISTIPKYHKITNFIETKNEIISFNNKFTHFVETIIDIYNNNFSNLQLINKIKQMKFDNNTENNYLQIENDINNFIKVLIIYVISDHLITDNKTNTIKLNSTKITNYNAMIKHIVTHIINIKDKIISGKIDSVSLNRHKIIYNNLMKIKDKLFVCDYMCDELLYINTFISQFSL